MAEQVHEKADHPKVRENIQRDAKIAVGNALNGVRKSLTDRGFDSKEITPIIKEGAFDGAEDFK